MIFVKLIINLFFIIITIKLFMPRPLFIWF